MNELIDNKPEINVRESEYKRLLGLPADYKLEGKILELAEWAKQWYKENGQPWIYAVRSDKINISNEKLFIDNIEFSSHRFREQLTSAAASGVIITAVSAGIECEQKAHQLWQEGKPDEYFFLEVYGSVVVEYLITTAGFRFCAWADGNNFAVLPHYSPGYPGWNAEDQYPLYNLIRQNKKDELPGELNILESGMLSPKKSLLAVFGITKETDRVKNIRELIPCENCSLHSCNYRRASFRYAHTQIEDVRKLQPDRNELYVNKQVVNKQTILNPNGNYKVNKKTLQKWADERLDINILHDDSVEARFRYEGTTCSNMGHKLEFEYLIKLSPPAQGYRIIDLQCSPAADDEGHSKMCEYLVDPEALMNSIGSEKPLLNRQLNEVLNWERSFSPEGCYCNYESREHKWGLVLEALHFKLALMETNN
jgi:hypothetical protein